MTPTPVLPTPFESLQPFAAWSLATETARNDRRLSVPFPQITAFADAMLPRVPEICAFVDRHPLDHLPEEAKTMMYMLLSLAEVAPAIESYDPQAAVIDGYESARFTPNETHRLRPKI